MDHKGLGDIFQEISEEFSAMAPTGDTDWHKLCAKHRKPESDANKVETPVLNPATVVFTDHPVASFAFIKRLKEAKQVESAPAGDSITRVHAVLLF